MIPPFLEFLPFGVFAISPFLRTSAMHIPSPPFWVDFGRRPPLERRPVKDKLSHDQIKSLIRYGVLLAALTYAFFVLIEAVIGILILFSLVALIVIVLNPAVGWLERHHIPRPLSATVMAFLVLGLVGLLVWLAVPPAAKELRALAEQLPYLIDRAQSWLVAQFSGGKTQPIAAIKPSRATEMISQHAWPILSRIGTYTISAVELVVSVFVVFISVIYTLSTPRPVAEGFLRTLRPDQRERATDLVQKIADQERRWAYSVAASMLAVFVLVYVLLGPILHLDFAFLFAVIAALLEFIPALGPILGAALPTLIALGDQPAKAIWVIVGFIVIQQIENHLIIPLILGRGVRLHPVSVVFAVLIMAVLFGLVGIFLAVPVLAAVKVLLQELYYQPRETTDEGICQNVEQIVSGEVGEEDDEAPEP